MTRKRQSAKLSKEYSMELSEKERVTVSWVMTAKDRGYDFAEAKYVENIIDVFGLDELINIEPERLDDVSIYILSGYEVQFLFDMVRKLFDEKAVQAGRILPMMTLYRAFEEVLNAPEKEEDMSE